MSVSLTVRTVLCGQNIAKFKLPIHIHSLPFAFTRHFNSNNNSRRQRFDVLQSFFVLRRVVTNKHDKKDWIALGPQVQHSFSTSTTYNFNFNRKSKTDTNNQDQGQVKGSKKATLHLIMGKAKAKAAKQDDKATPTKARGKKRPAKEDTKSDDGSEKPKPKLAKVSSISDSLGDTDFSVSSKSPTGEDANFKIASWNINGVRAWLAKDGPSYLKSESPDILCVQELKCDISKIPADTNVDGYSTHWLSGDTEGYSGVGMYFKNKPLSIKEGIGIKKHDQEGRVITAEFEKFYLVNTYIPNSGRGLVRHKYRTKEWDTDFLEYLKTLDKKKPVIWCGDLNVAHKEIDIKNAKGNKKNAGFTQEERDNFTAVLEAGFIDSFRHLYPEEEHAYSFWAYFMNARAKNVGWRLDYFVISERFKENLCDSVLRTKVMGSDHCPIVLELAL